MYIQLTNVSKKIKSNDILKDINLRMESGKIYGFKGKNGCRAFLCDMSIINIFLDMSM